MNPIIYIGLLQPRRTNVNPPRFAASLNLRHCASEGSPELPDIFVEANSQYSTSLVWNAFSHGWFMEGGLYESFRPPADSHIGATLTRRNVRSLP